VPLVSNTDRFNRDCAIRDHRSSRGLAERRSSPTPAASREHVRHRRGVGQLAFEWLRPRATPSIATYYAGPIAKMVMSCELKPRAARTTLVYDMQLTPASLLAGRAAVHDWKKSARDTERVSENTTNTRNAACASRSSRKNQSSPTRRRPSRHQPRSCR